MVFSLEEKKKKWLVCLIWQDTIFLCALFTFQVRPPTVPMSGSFDRHRTWSSFLRNILLWSVPHLHSSCSSGRSAALEEVEEAVVIVKRPNNRPKSSIMPLQPRRPRRRPLKDKPHRRTIMPRTTKTIRQRRSQTSGEQWKSSLRLTRIMAWKDLNSAADGFLGMVGALMISQAGLMANRESCNLVQGVLQGIILVAMIILTETRGSKVSSVFAMTTITIHLKHAEAMMGLL